MKGTASDMPPMEGTMNANSAAEAPAPPRPFRVTLFRDEYASTLEEMDLAIWDLRDLVLSTSAANKDDLRLLELATFGNVPSRITVFATMTT
jgi:hypothetical protein